LKIKKFYYKISRRESFPIFKILGSTAANSTINKNLVKEDVLKSDDNISAKQIITYIGQARNIGGPGPRIFQPSPGSESHSQLLSPAPQQMLHLLMKFLPKYGTWE